MTKKLEAKLDSVINKFLKDPNYIVKRNGVVLTYISRQGHILKKPRVKKLNLSAGYLRLSYGKYLLFHHRIMYAKFIGKLNKYMAINHLNGIRSDSSLENLEMVSHGENNRHKFRVSEQLPISGNQKLSQADVEKIRKMRKEGSNYKEICKKFNVCKATISYVINNKTFYKNTTGFVVKD